MAKITKILYERINSNIFSEYDVGLNYFYQNAIGVNDDIDNEFISYEEKQIKMKNYILGCAKKEYGINPESKSTMIGLSSLSNNVILVSKA